MAERIKSGDMTVGNPIRIILRFAIPLFIGNIFQQVYSLVDTMIAGYNLGDGAIAAIGATSSIYSLMIDFASGLNSGYGIVVARMFGAGDREGLKRSIAAMTVLDVGIAILLTAVSLWTIQPLMRALNVPNNVFSDAYLYISVILSGMTATILYNLFAGILRAVGNSRTPLYFLILSCAINLSMDLLFIVGLGWGVQGAAAATVIAEGCSALFAGVYLFCRYRDILPERQHFRLDGRLWREMAGSGFAMAVMLCVVDLGSVAYQRAVNALGETLIVAHTAARKLIVMFMMPLSSIATAYSTFVSQNWGAGKRERVRRSLKSTMAMEVGWGAVSWVLMLLFGTHAVRLLTGTADEAVIKNAVLSIQLHFVCFPALGVLLALRTALQAMGQKVVPVVSSGVELGIKILAGFWLIPALGYLCVCLTEPLIWSVCMLFLIAVFRLKKPLGERYEEKLT